MTKHLLNKIYTVGEKWTLKVLQEGLSVPCQDAESAECSFKIWRVAGTQSPSSIDTTDVSGEASDDPFQNFNKESSLLERSVEKTLIDLRGDAHPNDWTVSVLIPQVVRSMTTNETARVCVPAGSHQLEVAGAAYMVDITLHKYFVMRICWPETEEYSEKVLAFVATDTVTSQWKLDHFSVVESHFKIMKMSTGEIVVDTRNFNEGKPHVCTLGCGDVPPGLDSVLRRFTIGQTGYAYVQSVAGFGPYIKDRAEQNYFISRTVPYEAFLPNTESVFDLDVNTSAFKEDRESCLPSHSMKRTFHLKRPQDMGKCAEFSLIKSNIDFTKYIDDLAGEDLIIKDISVVGVYNLIDKYQFKGEHLSKFLQRFRTIAKRFFAIQNYCIALYCYAFVLYELDNVSDAALKKEKVNIKLNQSIIHTRIGEYKQAREILDAILINHPDHLRAVFLSARNEVEAGEFVRAEELFRRALRIDEKNHEVLVAYQRFKQQDKQQKLKEKETMARMVKESGFSDDRPEEEIEYIEIKDRRFDVKPDEKLLKATGLVCINDD